MSESKDKKCIEDDWCKKIARVNSRLKEASAGIYIRNKKTRQQTNPGFCPENVEGHGAEYSHEEHFKKKIQHPSMVFRGEEVFRG